MNRRKILIALAAVITLGVVINLSIMIYRLQPRQVPAADAALQRVAFDILEAKCLACHDSRRGIPFYARIPGPGALIRKDMEDGVRHWNVHDVGHLGAAATAEEQQAETLPLGRLIKLRATVAANTMPPLQYYAVHWGTWLTATEKEILTAWAESSWDIWLTGWGIEGGAAHDVHPIPDEIPYHKAKAAMGERLYHDPRFSSDNTIACVSCHAFDKGGTDNLPLSIGVDGLKGGVNAPTVFNAVFNMRQFWDGRAKDLAEQAGGPPLNPVEMASKNWEEIIAKFEQDSALKESFLALYPQGFSEATLTDAIGEFEKCLITPNSPFDRFLKGDKTALSQQEQQGYAHFQKYRCADCHAGPGMGGLSFEHADLKADPFAERGRTADDAGLAAHSENPADTARFKVPLLRNIALTAPYLHDGSEPELAGAVNFMFTHLVGQKASANEIADLTAFLGSLTGELWGKPLSN